MRRKIENHIMAIKLTIKAELENCLQVAVQNDGSIDNKEKRLLKKLKRSSEKYIKKLEKIT